MSHPRGNRADVPLAPARFTTAYQDTWFDETLGAALPGGVVARRAGRSRALLRV